MKPMTERGWEQTVKEKIGLFVMLKLKTVTVKYQNRSGSRDACNRSRGSV